jgi:hypothetical protein
MKLVLGIKSLIFFNLHMELEQKRSFVLLDSCINELLFIKELKGLSELILLFTSFTLVFFTFFVFFCKFCNFLRHSILGADITLFVFFLLKVKSFFFDFLR